MSRDRGTARSSAASVAACARCALRWSFADPRARLPFRYNAQRTLHWFTHASQPGYWEACKPVAVLHFSSSPKPWQSPDRKGELELIWWQHFMAACG